MKKEVVLNMILSSVDKGSGVWILEVVGGWVGVGVGVVGSVCDKGHCYRYQSIILQYTRSFSSAKIIRFTFILNRVVSMCLVLLCQ